LDLFLNLHLLESLSLGVHVERNLESVVHSVPQVPFLDRLTILWEPAELSGDLSVQFFEMIPTDWPCAVHIVSDDVVLCKEVFAAYSPPDHAWNPTIFSFDFWLIVYSSFVWMHLFSQIALVGRLIDT